MVLRSSAKTICSVVLAALVVASGWLERTHLAHCHGSHDSASVHALHGHDADSAHGCHGESHHEHADDACHEHAANAQSVDESPTVDLPTCGSGHDPSECAVCRHLGLTSHPASIARLAMTQLVAYQVAAATFRSPELRVWKRVPIRGPPTI